MEKIHVIRLLKVTDGIGHIAVAFWTELRLFALLKND